jgi:hypothetical protein
MLSAKRQEQHPDQTLGEIWISIELLSCLWTALDQVYPVIALLWDASFRI